MDNDTCTGPMAADAAAAIMARAVPTGTEAANAVMKGRIAACIAACIAVSAESLARTGHRATDAGMAGAGAGGCSTGESCGLCC